MSATGDVVSVTSDVPSTSSRMRAAKNSARAQARGRRRRPGRCCTSALVGSRRSALRDQREARAATRSARRPRAASRHGTPETRDRDGDGDSATTPAPPTTSTANSATVNASVTPIFARASSRCTGESTGTYWPNGPGRPSAPPPRRRQARGRDCGIEREAPQRRARTRSAARWTSSTSGATQPARRRAAPGSATQLGGGAVPRALARPRARARGPPRRGTPRRRG